MRIVILVIACLSMSDAVAQQQTLADVKPLTPNSDREPLAKSFSLDKGIDFLDHAALDWTSRRKCFTCHTNFAYLMARPMVASEVPAHKQVRQQLESLVNDRWEDQGPRWDAEVVMSAAVLAMNDSLTTNKLSPTARTALDRMWTVQRDDGGFDWLKCGWPPMEIDDDYGIAMCAIAAAVAPDEYAQTGAAQQGLKKLRSYLADNPPPTLHHTSMLIWADSYGSEMLSPQQRDAAVKKLRDLQKEDGGWATATLADWQRADGSDQDLDNSDAYGTAFVVFVLQRSGVPATDPAIESGIAWLKANQRRSGRWFSRSLYQDSTHYLSHAATAMAVMAIQSAEQ